MSPVVNRMNISDPDAIIDQFLEAHGAGFLYYLQMSFPIFVMGDELKALNQLREACQRRMKKADADGQGRLRLLPAIVAANSLPFVEGADAQTLREIVTDTQESALSDNNPSRLVIGLLWSSLTAAVIRNRTNWQNFTAGASVVTSAADRCLDFLRGDDALLHTAIAAWQFLLTYSRALDARNVTRPQNEIESINAAMRKVEDVKNERSIWFDRIEAFYRGRRASDQMLPEYFELIVGRRQTQPGSVDRLMADFFVQVRLQTAYDYYRIENGLLRSDYACDSKSARVKGLRGVRFLVDYGLSAEEWRTIKSADTCILNKRCIDYIDNLFASYGRFEEFERACPSDTEWYARNVPFRKLLPEEAAAGQAYSEPRTLEHALDALSTATSSASRLAFVAPALAYGAGLALPKSLDKDARKSILESVQAEAERLLQTSQYEAAFKQLAERESLLRKALLSSTTFSPGDQGAVESTEALLANPDNRTLQKKPAAGPIPAEGVDQSPLGERREMNTPSKQKKISAFSSATLAMAALFGGASHIKVRFPDIETATRGFGLLYRSGFSVDAFGDFIYGLSSDKQLELLKSNNVDFEIVECH